jgi:CzcA family heavy metal efflux pump
MMRSLVASSLQFRFLIIAIAAVLVTFGAVRLRNMPVDVFPEFAPPQVEVQTEALGLSAAEVENLITLNLEELLSGVSWLKSIRSESVPGLSSIRLTFEPGTDVMRARQLMQERLTLAYTLPNVSKPPVMLQPVSATSRVMMIGLSSKELSPMQLSVIAQWTIKPKLLGVPGVANVAIWGERKRQLQVQVDPERLRTHGIKQEQIVSSAGDALWVSHLSFLKSSVPGTGGWIDAPNQRLEIRHILPMSSAEDLARVSVDGTNLRLGDVAKVVEGHPPLIGDAVINDRPGLLLVVEKFPGANTLDVTRGVEAALKALRTGLPGVEMDASIFRAANFVEMAIDNLATALLIGAALVAVVLGILLFEWRITLICLVAIPLSLIAAGLVLYLTGATINSIIMAGFVVALGAVVDDAVVFTENIARRLRQHRQEGSDKSTSAIIVESALEIRNPIVYATLIIALAVTPVFFMTGLSGAFLKPLALSYGLALLASLVVALTVTPALCVILLNKSANGSESPLLRWLRNYYAVVLSRVIRAPRATLTTAGVVALAGFAVWPLLGLSLLPAFKERDFLMHWETKPGTSHPEMYRLTAQASRELRSIPGVRSASAHVGRAVTGDQVVDVNSGQIWINLDPKADQDATLAAIRATVDGYPGIDRDVQTYLKEKVREVLTGTVRPVVVRLYGAEREILRRLAGEVRQVLSRIDGLVDLQVQGQLEEPQVQVKVDLAAAGRVGLKPGDVRRAASTVFSGIEVGKIFEAQKVFEVVVWSTPESRNSLTSIRELLMETPDGGHVRLGDVAEVSIKPTPAVIRHEAVSPYVDVSADVRGREVASVVREVEQRLQEVKFPLEYHPEVLGEYAERQAAQNRVLGVAVAVTIGIFLLLQACFRSWSLASAIFVALPAALVGGVLAVFASGGVLSLGSLVGFLAVFAIAARNSILLIEHYQYLEQHEGERFGPALIMRGTRDRLAPILMTMLATGVAVLPLVLFGNVPGNELEYPMAVVILGGLITAILLSLLVVPALYLLFGSSREPDVIGGVN